ncbi:MAG: hypothetical protein HYV90_03785 [Candidatus Woesebacteria bacterium]|nr:MAG: hypothetical protein HYV90_03785 [Candidatus Woesebacteria bacterium]
MEITLEIKEIRFVPIKSSNTKVKMRADIHFNNFWLKGFKILTDNSGKDFVTPPSYPTKFGFRQLFRTDDKSDWQKIHAEILRQYQDYLIKESANELPEEEIKEEEIDIPF